jgi:hypothetical protein
MKMGIVLGQDAATLLTTLFGIDPASIINVTLHCPLNGRSTLTIERVLTKEEYARANELLAGALEDCHD